MKKVFILFMFIITLSCSAYSQDLEFTPDKNGYFIYSNNPEAITDDILANGKEPAYIMNNENLEKNMYYLYLSHFNYTGNGGMGYDVELDTEITAVSDCIIVIHDAEFETGRAVSYKKNQTEYRYESDWGCLNVCAGMLNSPIISADGKNLYTGHDYKPVTLNLKKGETVWLSSYLNDYKTTHFCMPVHIQAKIEIQSGNASMNVAAFKHNGTLGDRSDFNKEHTAFGRYWRDRCLKGIAHSLPHVTAELSYAIDDTIESGTALPVTIHNQYVPEGTEITKWVTNLNPQDDIWSKRTTAENDMLPLYYKDDSKYELYGGRISPEKRDNLWVFDTTRSDTRQYEASFPVSRDYYEPNYKLDVSKDNQGYGCSMGNYGVTTSYHLSITNKGTKSRYFEYRATTSANLIVYLSDESGNFNFAVSKTMSSPAKSDYLASKELAPGETTDFWVNVILPVNYNGGTQNEFIINDSPQCQNYDALYKDYEKKDFYDDKNYVLNYKNVLPEKTLNEFFGNLESYELVSSDNIKIARWCAWDGLPNFYYNTWGFSKLVITDKDFNIIGEKAFDSMPISMSCINGVFYVTTARDGIFATITGEDWWNTVQIPREISFDISKASDWAKPYIGKMLSYGFIPDNTPNAVLPATRLEFCRLTYSMLNKMRFLTDTAPENTFTDTSDISCLKLNEAGIVLGMGDGIFSPNEMITREQAAVILSRTAEFMDIKQSADGAVKYNDNDKIADWAKDAVKKMYTLEIMIGTDDNNFSPLDYYTTEQSITTLLRLFEKYDKVEIK